MAHEKLTPPMKCPRCGSTEISASEYAREVYSMTDKVVCESCGHTWLEHYKLVLIGIEETNNE